MIQRPRITIQELVSRNKHVDNDVDQFHWRAIIRPEFKEELKDLPGAREGFLDELLPEGAGAKKRLYKEIWALEDKKKIESVLWIRNDNSMVLGVDLSTGILSINGVELLATDPTGDVLSLRDWDYRSIAIRRVQQDFCWGSGPSGSRVIFVLGWQAEVDGKNIKSPQLQVLPSGHVAFVAP